MLLIGGVPHSRPTLFGNRRQKKSLEATKFLNPEIHRPPTPSPTGLLSFAHAGSSVGVPFRVFNSSLAGSGPRSSSHEVSYMFHRDGLRQLVVGRNKPPVNKAADSRRSPTVCAWGPVTSWRDGVADPYLSDGSVPTHNTPESRCTKTPLWRLKASHLVPPRARSSWKRGSASAVAVVAFGRGRLGSRVLWLVAALPLPFGVGRLRFSKFLQSIYRSSALRRSSTSPRD